MAWLISQFPELNHLEPEQRVELLRRLPWWTYPRMSARAVAVGSLLGAMLAGLPGGSLGTEAFFACWAIGGISIALYQYHSDLNSVRKNMRSEIALGFAGERPPFCFSCGYDLRELHGDHCPECGSSVIAAPSNEASTAR